MVELLKKLGEALKTIILKIIQFFKDIVDWFKRWKSINPDEVPGMEDRIKELLRTKNYNKIDLGTLLKTKSENDQYEVIRFVFDPEAGNIVDGNKLIAPEVDEELENVHKGKELVLYE